MDVRAMVRDIRKSAKGMWLQNIYDIDQKTYLFKMQMKGKDKVTILLESGVRFHTTKFTREKSNMPSAFSMKLRKHIRARKLENVRQVRSRPRPLPPPPSVRHRLRRRHTSCNQPSCGIVLATPERGACARVALADSLRRLVAAAACTDARRPGTSHAYVSSCCLLLVSSTSIEGPTPQKQ